MSNKKIADWFGNNDSYFSLFTFIQNIIKKNEPNEDPWIFQPLFTQ